MTAGNTAARWQGSDLIVRIRVQPRAGRDEIVGLQGERLKLRITAPPVDGRANTHLTRFLAKSFGVANSRVHLLSGETGRDKRFRIESPARLPPPIGAIL